MDSKWKVVLEANLVRQVGRWSRQGQRELFAVQELLEETGPEVFELYADSFTDAADWDVLDKVCLLEFFVRIGGRFLSVRMEIRPARTIVFRSAGSSSSPR